MKIGYDIYHCPIDLDIDTYCHMLIVGSSGSGKTQSWWYILGRLLQKDPNVQVTICDFKKEFDLLNNSDNYFGGISAYDGIMSYYETFCHAREYGGNSHRHLLIMEEYPSLVTYLTMMDKANKTKKSNDVMGAVAEILMMGRSMRFGIWVIMQRADSAFFNNGARDNFMVYIGLGNLSAVQLQMLFGGEEIPNKRFSPGHGIVLADGKPLQEIVIPQISDIIGWNRHVKDILKNNNK